MSRFKKIHKSLLISIIISSQLTSSVNALDSVNTIQSKNTRNYTIKNQKENQIDEEVTNFVANIFNIKSKAIQTNDLDTMENIYDTNTNVGKCAYEYEVRKVKYINNWAEKQGVKFIDIIPNAVIKRAKTNDSISTYTVMCNTEYKYVYLDEPEKINSSYIGTFHYLQLKHKDDEWLITKEWYTDPFADSLSLENIKTDSIKEYILNQKERDFTNIDDRRKGAVEYAFKYCGSASDGKNDYKYNKKYKNFNPEGGDCANFASQVLFEGGKFKKNGSWNYNKGDASASWINAGKFTHYMLYSGRASLISHGNYEKVYKDSYKLLPGDFIAYEKKGDITHVSMVTGADSKGYTLVTCHNTDRRSVPWDLGWSDKQMKFYLIRVNY